MMNYKEFTDVNEMNGSESKYINVIKEDESIKAFSVDNSNPSYISFLRQLSEENPNDPHYTEWIQAGNNPEDFWTQTEEGEV